MTLLRLTTLLCLSITLASCGLPDIVKLGFISGQTGPFSDLGAAGLNGAIMAVEQRNASGGVDGRPIQLIIRDDEHNAEKAQAAFEELITEKVTAIIGPMTSTMATTLIPLANKYETVLMGGTVASNSLSGKDDFFLRAVAPAKDYATRSADFHAKHIQPRRVTVVFDAANRDYAENWAKDYVIELNKLGGIQIQVIEIDSRTQQELASVSAAIIKDAPDLATCVCSAKTAAKMMQMIRAKNKTIRFAVAAWAANHYLLELAGPAGEGTLVEQYHDLSDQSATYLNFSEAYQKRFKIAPDYAAVIAFDATSIVLDGLSKNPQRQSLKETLLKQSHFKGLQAPIDLNAYGDASRPVFYTEIKNGQFSKVQ